MQIDITLPITKQMAQDAAQNPNKALAGHLGTHFDVMDKVFPLAYTERRGIVFDVSGVQGRDIDLCDVSIENVDKDVFVAFCTGYIEQVGYGEQGYFSNHPQLSEALIDALVAKGVSIIGLDFAGIRRGKEHTPKDAYLADRGIFVVENLCNLRAVLQAGGRFEACTYPLPLQGVTGLPCRVIARV